MVVVVVVMAGWGKWAGWGPNINTYMQYLLQSLYATNQRKFSCKKKKKERRTNEKRQAGANEKKNISRTNMVLVIVVVTVKLDL